MLDDEGHRRQACVALPLRLLPASMLLAARWPSYYRRARRSLSFCLSSFWRFVVLIAAAAGNAHLSYTQTQGTTSVDFATDEQNAIVGRETQIAALTKAYYIGEAEAYQLTIGGLAALDPLPANIAPWVTRELAIATADLTRVQAAAAITETRLITQAQLNRTAAITKSSDVAAVNLDNAAKQVAYGVAKRWALQAWATGQNLVESGLVALSLYAPTLPPLPSLRDLSALPDLPLVAVDDYFAELAFESAPYGAVVADINAMPSNWSIPESFSGDHLKESLRHTSALSHTDAASQELDQGWLTQTAIIWQPTDFRLAE